MEKRLTADLNVVANSNLEIQLLDGDLNVIQKLDDEPNDVGGLTSAELKAKFDESGNIIKKYINETLIPAVLTDDATEEDRKQAEAARVAAEQGRVTAEEGRVSAESGRVSAEQARSEAESSRVSAENARAAAETARADETAGIVARATAQANAAAGSASQAAGSEQSAKNAAGTAINAAISASQSAAAASGSASQAQASAAAAAQSAASVDGINKTAQSWAVGGTGTRPGEDTDNAKYWAQQAQAAVGGDFATKVEAQGYVTAHNQSAEAHTDIRKALNGKAAGTHASQHDKDGTDPITPTAIGAVSYDAAQSLTDAQKAQARTNIGAAPDGYGLGGNAKVLTSDDDVNTIGASGWYAWVNNNVPINAIAVTSITIMRVDAYSSGVKVQTLYGATDGVEFIMQPIVARRMIYGSKIGTWEYVNPPMQLGVEYRTTERYLGKPVYAKLVDCGTIPAQGTHKDLVFSPDAVGIVSVSAYSLQRGTTLPFYDTNGVKYSIAGNGTTVMIWNYSESRLDTDVRALVKYTKTTD